MIRKLVLSVFIMTALLSVCGCGKEKSDPILPDSLRGQSFIYDELDYGAGEDMYTLRFTENGYKLYASGGKGVVSYGKAETKDGRTLELSSGGDVTTASYSGSAFEEPSVTVSKDGGTMRFTLASENAEDVYLSFLGTYCDEDAVLVLDRWNEWFLIDGEAYFSGFYDIYSDGSVELRSDGDAPCRGSLAGNDGKFDQSKLRIRFELGGKSYDAAYTAATEQYDAAHAMGTYTLSLYPSNVFEIHGMDGFLKALGTIENGKVTYFSRPVTNHAEKSYGFEVAKDGDTFYFPDTTPLLPRSGNISKETGYGSYWNAGTKLEFIKRVSVEDMPSATGLFPKAEVTGSNNFPDFDGGLKPVMPSVGTAKPLVLLIDFPDQHRPRHVTAENIESALFSLDAPDSLGAFYYRSSYGRLTVDGKVYGWYRMKAPRSSYESDSEIMREAVGYYIDSHGLDLADFDADNDGVVDSLYILWAGNMESGAGMWNSAYRSTWLNSPEEWNRKITGYIFVPGSTIWSSVPPLKCNTNSLIHETGHLLGLNDYYSYDTSERKNSDGTAYTGGALEGGLGGMDMMDTNIGDHNIFSKWLLGWADPVVIEYNDVKSLDGQTYRLKPSAVSGDGIFIKLKNEDSMYTELFVIEAVSPVLNFSEYSRLTRPVVRVLHVETSIAEPGAVGGWRGFGFKYDNSYTSTKYIGVIEADGKDSVLNFVPSKSGEKLSYEEEDYFCEGDMLTPDTYPNTNSYDGYGNASVPTGICIYIDKIESDGTAVIRLGYTEPKESLRLKDIAPSAQTVPYKRGEKRAFDASAGEICFTYDKNIKWATDNAERLIKVYCDLKPVEGVRAKLNGDQLLISTDSGFEANKAYTVVIPARIVTDADAGLLLNAFNGIYGFVTSP